MPVLALLLAVVAGFLAMGQVSDMQTVSRGYAAFSGGIHSLLGTATLMMLFLTVVPRISDA